jgi:hypothetical protein
MKSDGKPSCVQEDIVSARKFAPLATEPNVDECRTMPLLPEYPECLANGPRCRYAIYFGYGYLCTHPDNGAFQKGLPPTVPLRERRFQRIKV